MQRIAMRYPDGQADSPWFLFRLARSPVWVGGMAVILAGFVFHSAALASRREGAPPGSRHEREQ